MVTPNIQTIQGFVTDHSFIDQTRNISAIYPDDTASIATVTARAMSYFNRPVTVSDKRDPTTRSVNWSAKVSPGIIVDQTNFGTFTDTINASSASVLAGLFRMIDKLLFKYDPSQSRAQIETFLRADAAIAAIYVPDSHQVSTTLTTDTVYATNGSSQVTVPAFVDFEIKVPTGGTTINFVMKLYASVDAWLMGYNQSTIAKVVPALPYSTILSASILNSNDSIFSTASLTAELSRNTTEAIIGTVTLSGITKYRAIITDGINNVSIPFNIVFKGRTPTLFEIRNAIRQAVLGSGVGTEDQWKARFPGIFVSGRYYVLPLWNITYTRPDQIIHPRIVNYKNIETVTEKILSSLGYGDLSTHIDLLPIYYNKITAVAIPDLSGRVDVAPLLDLIPDYQDYSPSDEQYAYMLPRTKIFSRELNAIMSIDANGTNSSVYVPDNEGLLSFYSFTIDSYEVCVITKACFNTIMGSTQ